MNMHSLSHMFGTVSEVWFDLKLLDDLSSAI